MGTFSFKGRRLLLKAQRSGPMHDAATFPFHNKRVCRMKWTLIQNSVLENVKQFSMRQDCVVKVGFWMNVAFVMEIRVLV